MNYILILFCLTIIISIKINWKDFNKDYLSIENTNSLRGIMAITIVLHHIADNVIDGRFFLFLRHAGYLVVSLFFFFSGYGLMYQYINKGKSYLNHFWKKKILFFIIVFILDTLLYLIVFMIIGKKYTIKAIIFNIFKGHFIAGSSWYLCVTIIFYMFFERIYSNVRDENINICILTILIIGMNILWILIDYPGYWYYSNLSFPLGCVWVKYKTKIETICFKRYYINLFGLIILFLIFSYIPYVIKNSYIYSLCRICSAPIFAVLIVVSLMKINFRYSLWQKISIYSLEIFLIHVLVIKCLRCKYIYINSNELWCFIVLVLTIIMSLPVHCFNLNLKKKLL